MGMRLPRKKPRNVLLSLLYRLSRIPFAPQKVKFSLFLDLEWIFDRLSHEFSFHIFSPAEHPIRQSFRAFLISKIEAGHNVLDLGCGKGTLSRYLSEKAKSVVGVDHDRSAIDAARSANRKDNLTFISDDARSYLNSIPRESFDVLILSHILEHLDDPKALLLEFKGFFKYIYIEVPDFDRYYLNHYRKSLGSPLIYTDADHISEFDRDEMGALLAACSVDILNSDHRFGVLRFWCEVR